MQTIKFAPVQNSSTGRISNVGTLSSILGKGGSYAPVSKDNFKGRLKENGSLTNITLRLTYVDGSTDIINCGKKLSKELRAITSTEELQKALRDLAGYPIYKTETVDETGKPIMVAQLDENGQPVLDESGEPVMVQTVIYSVGHPSSNSDTSALSVTITEVVETAPVATKVVSFEDLIA